MKKDTRTKTVVTEDGANLIEVGESVDTGAEHLPDAVTLLVTDVRSE